MLVGTKHKSHIFEGRDKARCERHLANFVIGLYQEMPEMVADEKSTSRNHFTADEDDQEES